MSALGHYLEEEGIATTQISLIREHTEAMKPPRALWVPFVLGRPFGVPNDAAFQRRVVLAALRHRVILSPEAEVAGNSVDGALEALMRTIEVPRL